MKTSYFCEIPVLDQPKICGPKPYIRNKIDINALQVKGIAITAVSQENLPIEVVIGANFTGKIYTGKILPLNSELTAIETRDIRQKLTQDG